ncbi:MAG: CPBP family glutamic-type intramembrane protease [Planctomycetota bacterium]
MSRGDASPHERGGELEPSRHPSLSVGFLAAAPLALLYEWGVHRMDGTVRNTAERILTLPLAWFGPAADPVRQFVLLAATLAALVVAVRVARSEEEHVAPRVLRQLVEGAVVALALGPALIWSHRLLGSTHVDLGHGVAPGSIAPSLDAGALVAGGAFFEELVFRVGAIGLCFVLFRASLSFLGAPARAAHVAGESLAIVGAAALFAAFHLQVLSALVGGQGEPFDGATFSWRFLGGCLLGLVFQWRGFGVAAWSHGLFNLALLLGAGPGVLD